jgi:acetolactate synthase I/III small subunit
MITLVVLVENKPGVLTRVATLIRRRAFNIESLSVGHSETEGVSRMTLVVDTDAQGAWRLQSNLYKLIDVLRVDDVTRVPAVFRELAMIKVRATPETRAAVMQLVEVFRARVVDVAPDSLVIEITGTDDKIDSLVEVLRFYGILDLARTGRLAMCRGAAAADQPASRPQPAAPGDESIACSV